MTPTEHVIVVVEEECIEVADAALRAARAASKALRFGVDDGYPGTDHTNRTDLVSEVNDLLGSLELLQEHGVDLPGLFDRSAIDAKKARIRHWMQYAVSRGTLSTPREASLPTSTIDKLLAATSR